MDTLDKGMIHIPGRMDQTVKFHPTTQNGVQLKTYELLISEVFYLVVPGYA